MPRPNTIQELREQCAEEGTHSILDVHYLSEDRGLGAAFPMPESVMLELYGTTKPTRALVEEKAMERNEDLDRWECWYHVVYEDGAPSELYFEGCSGD